MIYTLANIHEVQDIISDMAKDIYGTRAACPTTPEAQVAFMNSYDERIEEALEDERRGQAARLVYLNQKHGTTFTCYFEAQRFNEKAAHDRFMDRMESEMIADSQVVEFTRRGSPMPAITAWEHGDI